MPALLCDASELLNFSVLLFLGSKVRITPAA